MDKEQTGEENMKALVAENLSKSFGGLVAVNKIDITLQVGEVVSVIGPNGAGKTTLLNLLSGYLRPNEGIIRIFGKNVTGLPAEKISRMGVGRTFQQPKIFKRLSVYENILVSILNSSSDIKNHKEKARYYTKLFGLTHVMDHEAGAISFGQQRLLEIARVLASSPKLVLLDEPTAGVHVSLVKKLEEIILDMKNDGKAVLIVEHNMPFVANVSDRVVVMSSGLKIAEGSYEEIRSDINVIEAYLGGR